MSNPINSLTKPTKMDITDDIVQKENIVYTAQKRKMTDVIENEEENRCIVCNANMGIDNPRQYCRKTYCENQ